jgi:hypothetical protein
MISIQRRFPEKSISVIYNALSFVQPWRILMKLVEKDLVLKLSNLIIDHAS